MPNFIDYNQNAMVVINYQDQLQPGTFEFAVQYLINHKIDTSVFYPRYKNEKNGRPAYDPAILLKIILFAYSKGITSSSEIEWCCQFNILFKALSCDTVPHFTTIANFVSSYSNEIESVFDQVLLVCHEPPVSGTLKELEEKRDKLKKLIRHHLDEQKRQDKEGQSDAERSERISQAIGTLNYSLDKINNFLVGAEPRMGQGKKPREVKSNITDNKSAKMKTSKGTIQGFNGVATVDKKYQIVVDAQAFGEGQEHHTLKPVLEKLEGELSAINLDLKKSQKTSKYLNSGILLRHTSQHERINQTPRAGAKPRRHRDDSTINYRQSSLEPQEIVPGIGARLKVISGTWPAERRCLSCTSGVILNYRHVARYRPIV